MIYGSIISFYPITFDFSMSHLIPLIYSLLVAFQVINKSKTKPGLRSWPCYSILWMGQQNPAPPMVEALYIVGLTTYQLVQESIHGSYHCEITIHMSSVLTFMVPSCKRWHNYGKTSFY